MTITDDLTQFYIQLQITKQWSDETFIKILAFCNVPRQTLSNYFDQCVQNKETSPLEAYDKETLERWRGIVKQYDIPKEEKLQLGKCVALMEILKQEAT